MAQAGAPPQVMLHLGLGSFHRAHQAVYLHRLLEAGADDWELAGGNLRPDMADTIDALIAQHGQYVLETVSPAGERDYTRIRSIRRVVRHTPDGVRLIAIGADAATRIVSFTVTEAGYYLDDNGRLDVTSPDVAADLAAARAGRIGSTIYGALSAILSARASAGAGPVTLLNCDNLRHNGARARAGLLQFIEQAGDAALLAWVQANTTCPNAMVDRITPRPTPDVRERVKAATGWDDAAPVMGERFIQWVIEDDFCNGRPAWETVGVQMVPSVAPYEEAKIRILNASHSAIAWAGTLSGLTYIHEGTRTPVIRRITADYVTEDVIPCLARPGEPSPVDLAAYRDIVLDRFSNDAIADTNQRVAADGFAKIPGFILPTIRERLGRGESIAAVARLPALFLTFLQRWHQGRLPFAYQDQAMVPGRAHAICDAVDPLAEFVAEAALWNELAGSPALKDAIAAARMDLHGLLGDAAMS